MGKGFHPKFFLGDGNQQIPHEIKEKSLSFWGHRFRTQIPSGGNPAGGSIE
jgi:hypothetical protein